MELLLPEVAAHHRVAALIHPVGEVLAGHADHACLPVLQVSIVDKIPLPPSSFVTVRLYYLVSGGLGNGSARMGGDYDRFEEAPVICMSHR